MTEPTAAPLLAEAPFEDMCNRCGMPWDARHSSGKCPTAAPLPDTEKSPVDDHHAHTCEACGHIWWHHRGLDPNRLESHKCPKCASGPYMFGYNTKREAITVSQQVRSHVAQNEAESTAQCHKCGLEFPQRYAAMHECCTAAAPLRDGLVERIRAHIATWTTKDGREYVDCADFDSLDLLAEAAAALAQRNDRIPPSAMLVELDELSKCEFLCEDYSEQCARVLDFANRAKDIIGRAATLIRAEAAHHASWVTAHQVDTDAAWRRFSALAGEVKKLLALMDPMDGALGDESDRVFSWHEFDELRTALSAPGIPRDDARDDAIGTAAIPPCRIR
jgi:hypothetical protein